MQMAGLFGVDSVSFFFDLVKLHSLESQFCLPITKPPHCLSRFKFTIQIYLTIKQTNIQMRNNTKFVNGKDQMRSKLMLVWMAHYNKKNTKIINKNTVKCKIR